MSGDSTKTWTVTDLSSADLPTTHPQQMILAADVKLAIVVLVGFLTIVGGTLGYRMSQPGTWSLTQILAGTGLDSELGGLFRWQGSNPPPAPTPPDPAGIVIVQNSESPAMAPNEGGEPSPTSVDDAPLLVAGNEGPAPFAIPAPPSLAPESTESNFAGETGPDAHAWNTAPGPAPMAEMNWNPEPTPDAELRHESREESEDFDEEMELPPVLPARPLGALPPPPPMEAPTPAIMETAPAITEFATPPSRPTAETTHEAEAGFEEAAEMEEVFSPPPPPLPSAEAPASDFQPLQTTGWQAESDADGEGPGQTGAEEPFTVPPAHSLDPPPAPWTFEESAEPAMPSEATNRTESQGSAEPIMIPPAPPSLAPSASLEHGTTEPRARVIARGMAEEEFAKEDFANGARSPSAASASWDGDAKMDGDEGAGLIQAPARPAIGEPRPPIPAPGAYASRPLVSPQEMPIAEPIIAVGGPPRTDHRLIPQPGGEEPGASSAIVHDVPANHAPAGPPQRPAAIGRPLVEPETPGLTFATAESWPPRPNRVIAHTPTNLPPTSPTMGDPIEAGMAENDLVPASQPPIDRLASVPAQRLTDPSIEYFPVPPASDLVHHQSALARNPHADPSKPVVVQSYDVETHIVTAGETFASLAQTLYGSATLARPLAEYNGGQVRPDDPLPAGLRVRIPPARWLVPESRPSASAGNPRPIASAPSLPPGDPGTGGGPGNPASRSVEAGVPPAPISGPTYQTAGEETLWSIAKKTLGDGRRAKEIFALNRDLLDSDTVAPAGILLRLPSSPPRP